MGYYRAGDFYRAGGYYRAGGLKIGKFLGGIARTAASFVPGPAGALVRGAMNVIAPARSPSPATLSTSLASNLPVLTLGAAPGRGRPEPGITGAMHRALPGGKTGFLKSRRLDVTNVKALRRAGRRMEGFLRLARTIERQLPHKIVHRAAGKRCR